MKQTRKSLVVAAAMVTLATFSGSSAATARPTETPTSTQGAPVMMHRASAPIGDADLAVFSGRIAPALSDGGMCPLLVG